VGTAADPAGTIEYIDPNADGAAHRFYSAVKVD